MFNGVEGGGYYLVICLISMMEEAVTTTLRTPLLQLTFGLPVIYCKYLRTDWASAD